MRIDFRKMPKTKPTPKMLSFAKAIRDELDLKCGRLDRMSFEQCSEFIQKYKEDFMVSIYCAHELMADSLWYEEEWQWGTLDND